MELSQFFRDHPRGALAFSGGTDSSLLVWAAAAYGADWRAYHVHSAFQPAFELADARAVARQCGLPMTELPVDILSFPAVAANPADRCYYCKQQVFTAIQRQALLDGYTLLADGTNASDDDTDRPGMRALRELQVRSPLRECGLTKQDVRALCRRAGLPIWDKPSYACLATRIPAGTPITAQALSRVEQGEGLLRDLGFSDFRIRLHGPVAVLQLTAEQFPRALAERETLLERLRPLFPLVTLDLSHREASV